MQEVEYVTIQMNINSEWHDVALISFPSASLNDYEVTTLAYTSEHALGYFERDDKHAVSLRIPVNFFVDDGGEPSWLQFIDDIIPSGASRRFWVEYLDIAKLERREQDFQLLKHGTIAPIGNLRIKESLPAERFEIADIMRFQVRDVIERTSDFLSYAQARGAIAGGATGAGGEAPKLLVRLSQDNEIWIDTFQDAPHNRDQHYLVKFPRGNRTSIDCDLLRAEYHFYHELQSMGFDTIPIEHMRLEEGSHYPSLWLPRFDIYFNSRGEQRHAMESVFSILKKSSGALLDHEKTIRSLIKIIEASHMVTELNFHFDRQAFVSEWVQRDLLNIIFGNSDNHGRNTAFIRGDGWIKLAPIYDFAPMKADPESVTRTIKWQQPMELGGEYDFQAIAARLDDLLPQEVLLNALRDTAKQCLGLKRRLAIRGVPDAIIEFPHIGFDHIESKLQRWGLL